MKIAIAGGSGFIGKHLVQHLIQQGDQPIIISRHQASNEGQAEVEHHSNEGHTVTERLTWEALNQKPELLNGVDAIVNLAGETINQRWTTAAKERILQSRIQAAEAVANIVQRLETKPRTVIQGSGISIYGSSLSETFDESSPARLTDFLASVVKEWEQAADLIEDTRVVKLRIGIVLGADGGALPKMLLPYRLGVGGRIGPGTQWMSWIHVEDMVRAIRHAIVNDDIEGPLNCTAPRPETNDAFGRTAGKVLHRPHWFPIPAALFKLALGEMSALLLEGQRVLPSKLQSNGFKFAHPDLEKALFQLYRTH